LEVFCGRYNELRPQVDAWLCEVKEAEWHSSQDIRVRYPFADFPSENQAIFNLKGSNYKLEVKVNYPNQVVLVVDIWMDGEIELLRRAS
jgi:mRNA interferase HigB